MRGGIFPALPGGRCWLDLWLGWWSGVDPCFDVASQPSNSRETVNAQTNREEGTRRLGETPHRRFETDL